MHTPQRADSSRLELTPNKAMNNFDPARQVSRPAMTPQSTGHSGIVPPDHENLNCKDVAGAGSLLPLRASTKLWTGGVIDTTRSVGDTRAGMRIQTA